MTQRVTGAALRLVLKSATVSAVADHGPLRSIELTGPDLRGVSWTPGDKLRIHLGGFELRTYTPISWDASAGSTRLIAYVHGDGPGATWCREVGVDVPCLLLGPSRSVRLDQVASAPILVGDETSIGLSVAWRTRQLGPTAATPPIAELFELTDVPATQSVLDAYGLTEATSIERRPDDAHLDDFAGQVADRVRANADAPLCLTGRAQTIAAVRRRLKAEGLADRSHRAKAYWDPNRSGLD